jgi:alanine racemase
LRIWPLVTPLENIKRRPLWAEISRRRLLGNYQKLRAAVGSEAELIAVVKANAYGHDLIKCAPLLAKAGALWLGVTDAQEGAAVRAVCPQSRILLMSGIFPGEADTVLDQALTPVVWEPWQLEMLEGAARARHMPPRSLPVHLEIDTGMARQGVRGALGSVLPGFHSGSCLRLEGVMTHFCAPESFSSTRPNPQLAGLQAGLDSILAHGLRPEWLHAGNSSTILAGPDRQALIALAAGAEVRLMLRPGLALFGYLDRFTLDSLSWETEVEFAPVLAWKTQVTSLRTLQAGETAGYGNTFVAPRKTCLALLPVGYADGLNRLLSNRGQVLIHGQKAPIAGRISMDQTVVDVTDISQVAIGDEAVLLGNQGDQAITAWDLADLTSTIPWEVLCAIGPRVPRLVVD